jgi:hypothetical protein
LRVIASTLILASAALTFAAPLPARVSAAGVSSADISCYNSSGTLRASRTLAANTGGVLMLGGGANADLSFPFVGKCVLSGTIPTGWTVEVTPYSTLTADPGSGNAGTIDYNTSDSTFVGAGVFTNSGTFVDDSPGLTQQIAVADFINIGNVVSNSPTFGFTAAPTAAPAVPSATFMNQGSVEIAKGATFFAGGAAGTTFILPPSGKINAIGTFNIANFCTFAMKGGSVTAGVLRTSQFLGDTAPTFNFAPSIPSTSAGTIVDTNGGALNGVIPKHWSIQVIGGSLTATPGSGNAGVLEYHTDNSVLLDPGTFTNSGTLVDDSTTNSQQIAVAKFVNTGTVVANGPGLGFQASSGVPKAVFLDQGSVKVARNGSFYVGGAANTTFVLPPGGVIDALGPFNIANLATFDMDGGSVRTGMLRTTQFLGNPAPTFNFAAHVPIGSTGAISDTNGGILTGVIAKGWRFDLTGGSLSAPAKSGNAGVFMVNGAFTTPAVFTNVGTFIDAGRVGAASVVNQAHATLALAGAAAFTASESLSNAGQVLLTPNNTLSVGGDYRQGAGGTLQIIVAGTSPGSTYGHLAVTGHASLGGLLKIVKGPGYAAKAGDTQQVITAAAIASPFHKVVAAPAGPGLKFKVSYSSTAVTLTVGGK